MIAKLIALFIIALTAGCTTSATGSHQSSPPADVVDAQDDGYAQDLYDRPPYDQRYDASELFDALCATCHGDAGDGQVPIDDAFSFDTPAHQWTNGPTVDGILLTLEDGIHDTAMQQFPQFKNMDREQLADYVLELRHALMIDEDDP